MVGALPNLIIIGVGRCGTTSLHQYLDQHPAIGMSALKELHFFSGGAEPAPAPRLSRPDDNAMVSFLHTTWDRGPEWYRRQFDPSFPVRGESSPSYSSPWFGRTSAARIAEHVPDVKLIFCVRDPVDRAVSHYRMAVANRRERRPIEQALTPDGFYSHASRFALRLEPYLGALDEGRVLIVDQDDLAHKRAETLAGIFRFLGVDDSFSSQIFEQRWNPATANRLGRALRRVRRWAAGTSVRPLERRPPRWLYRLTHDDRAGPKVDLSEPGRMRLAEMLADDTARLRRLTGRSFPAWSV